MNNTDIKNRLYHPKTDKFIFLAQIKAGTNYDEFKKIKNGIKSHPFGKHALNSTPLPKKLSDLRKNNIIPHSGNLEAEIAWIMESIKENSDYINKFIELKSQFENAILLGEYEIAKELLYSIDNEICVSNWGIENAFILSENNKGTEENWLKLNEISKNVKDGLSLFMAEQASKKSETKLTYIRYKNNFESIIDGLGSLLNEYLCFRLLYPGYTGFQNYSFIINVESASSIIDRYLVLVDILTEISIDNSKLVEKVINELIPIIPSDFRLKQLAFLNSSASTNLDERKSLIDFIDQYTRGNYIYCLDNAISVIKENPNTIEPSLIYIKSLIENKDEYLDLGVSPLLDSVSKDLYNIYSKNQEYDSSITNLLKFSMKYFSFKLGKQIFSIVSRFVKLLDKEKHHILLYTVNSEFINPIILIDSLFFKEDLRERILNKMGLLPKSISFQLNELTTTGRWQEIQKIENLSEKRKPVYIAKAIKNSQSNEELIKFIETLPNKNEFSIHSQWELTELLFVAYLDENEIQKALTLYVDNYFSNKFLVTNLNSDLLLEKIHSSDFNTDSIDLPIFYSIVSPDIYEQYVKYDDFVESLGISRPSELLDFNEIPKEKLIYFLKEICTIEILHHSMNFEGTDDIENERIILLKHLLVLDPNSETEYIESITEISQRSKIRKAIREVNKGRITINSQLLRNSVENDIKDNFLRFRELVDFSAEHNLQSIDPTNKLLNNYFNSMQEKSLRDKYVNINDPAFISFKSMIIDIRDKFILSKDFGLDGYLSTRIRHGTLINHIRSNFEAFNLINQKKDEDYLENDYWRKRIPTELQSKQDDIQKRLKSFSKEVDDLTEYLIKELIQIKTEKHTQKSQALFDYSLGDKTLAYLYTQVKDSFNSHTAFLNFVFEYLEASTEMQLRNIRELFKNQITEQYSTILKNFDTSIREIIGCFPFIDLTSSIVKCQTNIQNEIINIAEWFSIANPSSDLTLDIETIVQTAIEITNTIYPNESIEPKLEVDNQIPFASGTTNMIYIIRILLDNIIKHSGKTNRERNIIIKSDFINDTKLALSVSNDFNPELKERIEANLSDTKSKWNDKSDFTKSNIEGGSGFDKIRRILAVDMSMTNYRFDYVISESNVSIIIDFEIKFIDND